MPIKHTSAKGNVSPKFRYCSRKLLNKLFKGTTSEGVKKGFCKGEATLFGDNSTGLQNKDPYKIK